MLEGIRSIALELREASEPCWDEQTISPKYLPIDKSKPISAGHCAPSSIVLLRKLRREFPNELFSLAIGQVLWLKQPLHIAIDYHVWVQWHEEPFKRTWIIDITADQGDGINEPVLLALMEDLTRERGLAYQSYQSTEDENRIKPAALARAEVLSVRIGDDKR
ncbi:hypothetical protein CYG49_01370 [Candidatus Saccharibacteria bacterium]|nr:MAG: hypothetical protein CYG49_01370 [Candidatus Saccharibacteria bacterium]